MSEAQLEKSVVITGASTGIGRACALHLDAKGVRVFAGVRNEADGAALRESASDRLAPLVIDVTLSETIAAASRTIADAVGPQGLAGLVNNAGVFYGGPLELASVDEVRREFEVNVFGAIAVTQAFLPLLRAARGRIVNVSSVSGLLALPFYGPYSASKFALEAVSDSWRLELRPWGIAVAVVEPGMVDTPIGEKAVAVWRRIRDAAPPAARDLYGPIFDRVDRPFRRGIPAERVAEAVEHALFARRPKLRYLVGKDAKTAGVLRKLPARLGDWLIARRLPPYG